jgi:hypothetical protein
MNRTGNPCRVCEALSKPVIFLRHGGYEWQAEGDHNKFQQRLNVFRLPVAIMTMENYRRVHIFIAIAAQASLDYVRHSNVSSGNC